MNYEHIITVDRPNDDLEDRRDEWVRQPLEFMYLVPVHTSW